jgi:hypothetical protein
LPDIHPASDRTEEVFYLHDRGPMSAKIVGFLAQKSDSSLPQPVLHVSTVP